MDNPEDLVTTPFTAACVRCHDADSAKAHMRLQGGSIDERRASASPLTEACSVCHGSGRSEDLAVIHAIPEI